QIHPVLHPGGTFFRGRRREKDRSLRSPSEKFGVERDHHLEKLTTSHQGHLPWSWPLAHEHGPDGLNIRITLVVGRHGHADSSSSRLCAVSAKPPGSWVKALRLLSAPRLRPSGLR
ncbi:MAG: hypothetical protein ABSD97_17130, partial [Acidimicrobiales bacterium]